MTQEYFGQYAGKRGPWGMTDSPSTSAFTPPPGSGDAYANEFADFGKAMAGQQVRNFSAY